MCSMRDSKTPNGRVDVQIALIMAVVTADYWGNLQRPTIGLRSAAEHTDRWATSTQRFVNSGRHSVCLH